MNIAEIKSKPAQAMIVAPGLVATCAEVMSRKTGESKHGTWSLQPIGLKDDSGEIKAIIWNREDLSALKGKTVHLSALQTDRGWMGCAVEDNEYQGKTYKQIKASGNFLLEEYKPPVEEPKGALETASNGSGHAPKVPAWDEYSTIIKAAHKLAGELEPDQPPTEGGFVPDRARARAALVNTILIAYGKRDFKYDMIQDDDVPW